MAEEKQVRGRDIAAPLDTLEVSGNQYKLAFTNETFRLAEDVYEYRYGRAKNFAEIAMDLTRSKIGAIMAILYGAIVAAAPETEMTWEDFTRDFRITAIPGVADKLLAGVTDALPEADKQDDANP